MVNEISDLAKRENKDSMVMKIDFERACDCVSWNYLRYLFDRLKFRDKWKSWTEAIVFSSSMSVS